MSTVVTTKGYFQRIMESFQGVLVGIALFLGSFVVLYLNEASADLSNVAAKAIQASDQKDSKNLDGQFVYTSGNVTSTARLGDGLFLVKGPYLAINRTVEMYSWTEAKTEKTHKNLGGSETTTTTYHYTKAWEEHVPDSSTFNEPDKHQNPEKTYDSNSFRTESASVRGYELDFENLALPQFEPLHLKQSNLLQISSDDGLADHGNYIYIARHKGNIDNPGIGDMRVGYSVLNSGTSGTVFGKINGRTLESYYDAATEKALYRFFPGTRASALVTMHHEYETNLWLMRAIGFGLMWFGLTLIFTPITVLLDVVPLFGSLSSTIIACITFVTALVLSITTMVISMIFHSIPALVASALVACAIVLYIIKKKGAKKAATKT